MTFPKIKHIDDLRAHVAHMPEIRFSTNEDGFTIVCYMVAGAETFTSENKDWARECRGITFYPDGKIAARPLHKFFNIGELPETQMSQIKWDNICRVMDKRDGSMVHPVRVNGKIILKTKKSFYSDVAILATDLLHTPKFAEHLAFCEECVDEGLSPIFEFTSPKARIVLGYDTDDLKLLHIRNNVSGEYVADPYNFAFLMGYTIPCTEEYDLTTFTAGSLMNSLELDQDKEGYVIMFEDGSMMKGKTQWYLQLHRTIVFVRERDIAEMVVNETVDDYKSFLSMSGQSLDKVNGIEHRVLEEIRKIEDAVDAAFSLIKHLTDRKEAAMTVKGHPFFSAAMNKFNGKEYDVKEHFLKFILKDKFSLEQI